MAQQQLCVCASLDWGNVPLPHPAHHPNCSAQHMTLGVESSNPVITDTEHLRLMMEERVGAVGPPTFNAFAATGEAYVSFTIGRVVEEGELPALVANDEPAALLHFWFSYCRYVELVTKGEPESFVLYWREYPQMWDASGFFAVWARLLVSAQPILTNLTGAFTSALP